MVFIKQAENRYFSPPYILIFLPIRRFFSAFQAFFQVEGVRKMRIGNISSLPISIQSIKTTLLKSEKTAKLPVGPISPNPGALLLMQVTTAENVVLKS